MGSKSSASSASCTFLFTIFFSSAINFGVTFEADRSTTGTFFSFLSGSPLSVSFIVSCTVLSVHEKIEFVNFVIFVKKILT